MVKKKELRIHDFCLELITNRIRTNAYSLSEGVCTHQKADWQKIRVDGSKPYAFQFGDMNPTNICIPTHPTCWYLSLVKHCPSFDLLLPFWEVAAMPFARCMLWLNA